MCLQVIPRVSKSGQVQDAIFGMMCTRYVPVPACDGTIQSPAFWRIVRVAASSRPRCCLVLVPFIVGSIFFLLCDFGICHWQERGFRPLKTAGDERIKRNEGGFLARVATLFWAYRC